MFRNNLAQKIQRQSFWLPFSVLRISFSENSGIGQGWKIYQKLRGCLFYFGGDFLKRQNISKCFPK